MISFEMHSSTKGPVVEGRTQPIINQYVNQWERDVARHARDRWVSLLKSTIRNPTPHYWNQIEARPAGGGWTVWDRMVIYGPWLEGVGSRNATSRFKGYHNFRKMTTEMNIVSTPIGNRLLQAYIPRLD